MNGDTDYIIGKLREVIVENNGIATAEQLQKAGFSRLMLYHQLMEGNLKKESHGNYSLVDWQPDTFRQILNRSEKVIFSHATAAYLHGIIDRHPENYDVTVPQGDNVSKMKRDFDNLRFHYCKKELWALGMAEVVTPGGFKVRVYDPERCICDLIRDKKNVDAGVFVKAVKEYFSKHCDDEKIIRYAREMNVEKRVRSYMEILK